MRVALVYDRVNKFGGAERVLLALHKIWPDAPLFTAVYDPVGAKWADVFQVHPSFLNRIPLAKKHHELYPWLTPVAFESFLFDGYDVVISITSAEAKNIITKPGTLHICYCLTPTRYLWSGARDYIAHADGISAFMLQKLSPTLKRWDIVASSRPDYYLAISKRVGGRIQKYYKRSVEKIIYPPVNITKFKMRNAQLANREKYFLCVSRLVPYKRVDIVIDAFNKLGWPLKIIGSGRSGPVLKKKAKKNIEFIESLTDDALVHYYQECRAFVFAGDEDFGIAAVEAQACGKPVVCYRDSGLAETVIEGKTGLFFDSQTSESLVDALQKFNLKWYDSDSCRKNAQRFAEDRFKKEIKTEVQRLANKTI